jgi:hypothetical protein
MLAVLPECLVSDFLRMQILQGLLMLAVLSIPPLGFPQDTDIARASNAGNSFNTSSWYCSETARDPVSTRVNHA